LKGKFCILSTTNCLKSCIIIAFVAPRLFSIEQDPSQPTRLHLRGKPGQKAVTIEYADGNTDAENARGAQQWAAALRFLIKHANNT